MEHMGSSTNDWTSTPITGFNIIDVNGKDKSMPTFEFPKGYLKAPTLFPSTDSDNMNCELCGKTPIRTMYWLQNDKMKWTMGVGSECVTHFGDGASGKDNVRQYKINRAIVLDNDLLNLKKLIREKTSKIRHIGYGKEVREWNSANFYDDSGNDRIQEFYDLVKENKLDLLFEVGKTGRNRSNKKTIYWDYVYGAIPIFGYKRDILMAEGQGRTKERIEKDLLSWYSKNEKIAVEMMQQSIMALESAYSTKVDFNSEYMQQQP